MGSNKSKLNKNILQQLVRRTGRSPAEIKAMYAIFLQYFPSGRIESPRDLWGCIQKFSLIPSDHIDLTFADRLYRLFGAGNPNAGADDSIDFFQFIIISHLLDHGSPAQKISLYFQSLDVDHDGNITREDLQKSLPPTVQSQTLVQQLLGQWDMNRDGVVNFNDFERYIMSNQDLSLMFTDAKDRVRLGSVTMVSPIDNNPSTTYVNANLGTFPTSH